MLLSFANSLKPPVGTGSNGQWCFPPICSSQRSSARADSGIGNSSHPIWENWDTGSALVSITGVKIKGVCCGAGERELCLIINKAIRCSSLRVLFLCSSEQKIGKFFRSYQCWPLASVQGAQSIDREGPRCAWWHLSSGAQVSGKSLIRARNASGPEIVVRAAGECLIWTHRPRQWSLVCKEVTPAPDAQCHISIPKRLAWGKWQTLHLKRAGELVLCLPYLGLHKKEGPQSPKWLPLHSEEWPCLPSTHTGLLWVRVHLLSSCALCCFLVYQIFLWTLCPHGVRFWRRKQP